MIGQLPGGLGIKMLNNMWIPLKSGPRAQEKSFIFFHSTGNVQKVTVVIIEIYESVILQGAGLAIWQHTESLAGPFSHQKDQQSVFSLQHQTVILPWVQSSLIENIRSPSQAVCHLCLSAVFKIAYLKALYFLTSDRLNRFVFSP